MKKVIDANGNELQIGAVYEFKSYAKESDG